MVTRGYYDDEEPSFRRYSARGHGYPLSHDRDLPPAPLHISYDGRRSHYPTPQETRNGEQSPSQDSNVRPRSRIPVACGRCRKRKIRCSGDNGGPCTNCKSAGNEQCQFLRVSSTEAQMKSDGSGSDFGYDAGAAVSRMQCRIVPQGPQYAPLHTPSVTYDAYQYRSNSLSAYQYPVKSYYAEIPAFAEFPDENVDYGLQASPYQLMNPDHLAISPSSNYASSSVTGRGWTPAPQIPKNASLFLEQEPTYNHGQLPYHSGSFPLRPAISPESKGLALSGMPSLPAPIAGNDRVLPYPAANRQAQSTSFLRSNDGLPSASQAGYQPYSIMPASHVVNGIKAVNNTVSENSSYHPMSSTSPESLPSSQATYNASGHSDSISQQQNEMYTPSNEDPYNHAEPSDSSYGTSSARSERGSQSSQTTTAETSLPSLLSGNLANGHPYIPYNHAQMNFPTPSMELHPAPPHPRRGSAIQAA